MTDQRVRSVHLCPPPGWTLPPRNKVDSGPLPSGLSSVQGVHPLNGTIARTCAYARTLAHDKSGWGVDSVDRVSRLSFSPPSASLSTNRLSTPGVDTNGQSGQAATGTGWSA